VFHKPKRAQVSSGKARPQEGSPRTKTPVVAGKPILPMDPARLAGRVPILPALKIVRSYAKQKVFWTAQVLFDAPELLKSIAQDLRGTFWFLFGTKPPLRGASEELQSVAQDLRGTF
jgi:hypothetical protein